MSTLLLRIHSLRLQMPVAMLILLLQRSPTVQWLLAAEGPAPSIISNLLRSALMVTSAAAATHTLTGATTFATVPDSPAAATVGQSFSMTFSMTGAPTPAKSYKVLGTLPPGLSVPGINSGTGILNAATGIISGTPTTAGSYSVTIQAWDKINATGKTDSVQYPVDFIVSAAATIAPAITTQPTSKSVTTGATATFTAAASGTPAPTLQWQRNPLGTGTWSNLSNNTTYGGSTTTSLTVVTAIGMSTDTFRCVATNSVSTATSNAATLTVNAATSAPVIGTQPTNQTVTAGATATFTAAASGNPTPTLQWQRNPLGTGTWSNISNNTTYGGSTTTSLTVITAIGMSTDTFRCLATNSVSTATSNAATLTVSAATSAPVIGTQPTNQTVTAGATATFTAAASGNPTPTLQWQRNPLGTGTWSNISNNTTYGGSTTTSLTVITAIGMNTDTFRCVATNSVSTATSNAATLTVSALAPPVITVQPQSLGAGAGQQVSISVTASGASSYQWYKGGVSVPGATGSTLTIPAIDSPDAGIYDVVATNTGGSTLSVPIVVGVVPASGQPTTGSVVTRTVWQNILHPNGSTYDQFLLSGASGTFKADPGQIARMSFLDENGSIVQVEMSGAGAVTVSLAGATGPAAPALYNQSGIQYMKGKATVILAGADDTTHFTIYSVGTFNNPGVTIGGVAYVGWADIAVAGIVSTNGKLGGIHQGNVKYNSSTGFTGIYAPTVTTASSLLVVHDIAASGSAQPYLYFGSGGTVHVKIAGSALAQPNADSITVGGLAQVTMGAGQDSCGRAAIAQAIQTHLVNDAGTDVTTALVVGP